MSDHSKANGDTVCRLQNTAGKQSLSFPSANLLSFLETEHVIRITDSKSANLYFYCRNCIA